MEGRRGPKVLLSGVNKIMKPRNTAADGPGCCCWFWLLLLLGNE